MATTLPDSLRRAITLEIEALKACVPGGTVRWVSPQNIHLTLKFLGEISNEQADSVISTVRQVVDGKTTFELVASGLGTFPNMRRPSVVWIGVLASDESLATLQAQLESGLSKLGFEPEGRPFHPHLTLGRVRRGLGRSSQSELANALSMIDVGELGAWRVKSVTLMKSDLRSEGPHYTELVNVALGAEQGS